MSHHSFNKRSGGEDDQDYNDVAFIKEQEEILKQIEEQNMKKKLEETRSLKLIQKLSLDGELASSNSSYDSFYLLDQVEERQRDRERGNILQSQLDSQNLRMIKEGSSSEVGGSSQSLEVTSVASEAPERRPKTQRKVSEFEAERRRAVFELKQRIKAQVSKGTGGSW